MGEPASGGPLDFDLHGAVGVRLIGADPADAAAVRRQLGPIERRLERPPEIEIEYVDRLPSDGPRRMIGRDDAAFDRTTLVILRGRFKTQVRVAIPFDRVGGPCRIVAERGSRTIPLLVPIVNLAALERGLLPIHASAFVHDGRGHSRDGLGEGRQERGPAGVCGPRRVVRRGRMGLPGRRRRPDGRAARADPTVGLAAPRDARVRGPDSRALSVPGWRRRAHSVGRRRAGRCAGRPDDGRRPDAPPGAAVRRPPARRPGPAGPAVRRPGPGRRRPARSGRVRREQRRAGPGRRADRRGRDRAADGPLHPPRVARPVDGLPQVALRIPRPAEPHPRWARGRHSPSASIVPSPGARRSLSATPIHPTSRVSRTRSSPTSAEPSVGDEAQRFFAESGHPGAAEGPIQRPFPYTGRSAPRIFHAAGAESQGEPLPIAVGVTGRSRPTPRGPMVTVALVGPDGAGKSTVARRVVADAAVPGAARVHGRQPRGERDDAAHDPARAGRQASPRRTTRHDGSDRARGPAIRRAAGAGTLAGCERACAWRTGSPRSGIGRPSPRTTSGAGGSSCSTATSSATTMPTTSHRRPAAVRWPADSTG